MSKIAVIYWSGTGNTAAMADAVAEGVKNAGGEASLFACRDFDSSNAENYDGFAFGCPAMGAEVLEEEEFDPLFTAVENSLSGKKVALFGSYGWGDGEWMRNWEARCKEDGINLVTDSVICNGIPDDDSLSGCSSLGAALV